MRRLCAVGTLESKFINVAARECAVITYNHLNDVVKFVMVRGRARALRIREPRDNNRLVTVISEA